MKNTLVIIFILLFFSACSIDVNPYGNGINPHPRKDYVCSKIPKVNSSANVGNFSPVQVYEDVGYASSNKFWITEKEIQDVGCKLQADAYSGEGLVIHFLRICKHPEKVSLRCDTRKEN